VKPASIRRQCCWVVPPASTIWRSELPGCVNGDCDCSDFQTYTTAKQVLEADSGDSHRLDGDSDSVDCEGLHLAVGSLASRFFSTFIVCISSPSAKQGRNFYV